MQAIQCRNHPGVPAYSRCAGCAEAFCGNCMVNINGQNYCGSCKVLAVQGRPMYEQATMASPAADDALKYAIIGIFCFGIILEPIAIAKALKAKKMMAANPNLTGSGKATAALIIGIVGLVLWVLSIIAKVANAS